MGVPSHLNGLVDLLVEAILRDIDEAESQTKKPAVLGSLPRATQTDAAVTEVLREDVRVAP
jgi:hypothetical protein